MRLLSLLFAFALAFILNVFPASAGMLQDGSFIHDLKLYTEGKLGSELALKLVDADLSSWVKTGQSYCETRRAGYSQEDWLQMARKHLDELQDPALEQSMWLLYKKTAKAAKPIYCPEFS